MYRNLLFQKAFKGQSFEVLQIVKAVNEQNEVTNQLFLFKTGHGDDVSFFEASDADAEAIARVILEACGWVFPDDDAGIPEQSDSETEAGDAE